MCNHDFSRVSFAAELSTKLVYNSAFVKDYDYIFCICYYISTYIYIYIRRDFFKTAREAQLPL